MKLLEAEMRKHHLKLSSFKADELHNIAKAFSMQSFDDLLVSIGYSKVSAHQIVNRLLPERPIEEAVTKAIRPPKEQKGISIKGIDHILYHTSMCCFPLP